MTDEFTVSIFHKSCIQEQNDFNICKKCNQALLIKCRKCKVRFSNICYNNNCEPQISKIDNDYLWWILFILLLKL